MSKSVFISVPNMANQSVIYINFRAFADSMSEKTTFLLIIMEQSEISCAVVLAQALATL